MEIRLQIPQDFIDDISRTMSKEMKGTDIARDAITLFKWAVEERAKGKYILSGKDGNKQMTRLVMSSLEDAAPQNSQVQSKK